MSVLETNFIDYLQENLKKYQGILSFSVKGMIWEEIFIGAAKKANLTDIVWQPNSHGRGADVTINGIRFSMKTGSEEKSYFKMSSYRTKTQETIEEKVDLFIEDSNNFDYYLFLTKDTKSDKNYLKYTLYTFPAQYCNYKDFQFSETAKRWFTEKVDGIRFIIPKSMSDQLWVYIDKDKMERMADKKFEWSVLKTDMGETHIIVEKGQIK